MSDSKKQKESEPFENKIWSNLVKATPVVECFSGVCSKLFQKELPFWVFVIVFTLGIIVLVIEAIVGVKKICEIGMHHKIIKYFRKVKEYKGDLKKKKKKLRKKYFSEVRKMQRPRLVKSAFVLGAIVVVFATNPNNAQAFFETVQQRIGVKTNEEKKIQNSTEDEEDQGETTEQGDDQEEITEIRVPKPERYRFRLVTDKNTLELQPSKNEIKNQVFFYDEDGEIDLEEHCSEVLDDIFASKKVGIDLKTTKDQFGNSFSNYEEEEANFKQDVAETKNIQYWEDWIQESPSSSELNAYMEGRMNLNSIEVDGKSGSHRLFWRLANDCQYYAQEYEIQTENLEMIEYYYSLSIYYCMEALKYDMSNDEYEEIFIYMKTRYQDIARDESLVSDECKLRARGIVEAIDKYEIEF